LEPNHDSTEKSETTAEGWVEDIFSGKAAEKALESRVAEAERKLSRTPISAIPEDTMKTFLEGLALVRDETQPRDERLKLLQMIEGEIKRQIPPTIGEMLNFNIEYAAKKATREQLEASPEVQAARNGPTGFIKTVFDTTTTRFREDTGCTGNR
jgi:hypothetical protein